MKANVGGIDVTVKYVLGLTDNNDIVVGVDGIVGETVETEELVRLGEYASALIHHTLDTFEIKDLERAELIEAICTRFVDTLMSINTNEIVTKDGYIFPGPAEDVD